MMQQLELIDALLLGNEALDNDHRELVDLANELIENIKIKNEEAALESLRVFCNKFYDHDKFEIDYLKKIGFPEVQRHQDYRNYIVDEMKYIYHLFWHVFRDHLGCKTFRDELASFLFETLIREDLSFKSFLIEFGYSTHTDG